MRLSEQPGGLARGHAVSSELPPDQTRPVHLPVSGHGGGLAPGRGEVQPARQSQSVSLRHQRQQGLWHLSTGVSHCGTHSQDRKLIGEIHY